MPKEYFIILLLSLSLSFFLSFFFFVVVTLCLDPLCQALQFLLNFSFLFLHRRQIALFYKKQHRVTGHYLGREENKKKKRKQHEV